MTGPTHKPLEIATDRDRGRGDYSAYHALWHLAEIGVVADLTSFASDAWDLAATRVGAGARRTRVALIDTSVAAGHPNLNGAINADLAIDFFSSRLGVAATPDALTSLLTDHDGHLPVDVPATVTDLWVELLAHLTGTADDTQSTPIQPATSPSFSAHGTAMAGLIGARPVAEVGVPVAAARVFDTASGTYADMPSGTGVAFAYAGVDPFCEIVPISTNFDPEPEQLILALLYAAFIKADVIVLARDFPTPASLAPGVDVKPDALSHALGVGISAQEIAGWDNLEELSISLSKRVPIVCAAGNVARDSILFPASLADDTNGIIAVGARAATGQVAAYSPVSDQISVYAPSGDGERLDDDLQRLDTQSAGFNPNDFGAKLASGLGNFGDPSQTNAPVVGTHAPQDLVSTDVPGRAGYNASPHAQVFGHDGAVLDYRSAYCRFSGTSGATALTAGMLSLALSAGRLTPGAPDFGITAKEALLAHIPTEFSAQKPVIHWSTFQNVSQDAS